MARYALVVGISEYKHLPSPLSKTLGDAEAVASLLRSHGDFQEVILLNKPKLMKADLFAQLNRLLIEQAAGSEVLIYYTGHGVLVEDCGVSEGFLAPSDCAATKDQATNGIKFTALNNLIAKSKVSSLVMFLDCCHSGALLKAIAESLTAFNKTDKDYLLISACRDFEEASAMKSEAHSIFTGALLEALSASRQNDEGKINSGSLFGFIADHLKQKQQEPIQLGYGRAMKIVDYRQVGEKKAIDETCPYVGLNAFDQNTAKYFCGRDSQIDLLLRKIEESRFVPVIGTSGSGKSSLVKAGLIPALEKQGWCILPPIKPWTDPLAILKKALVEKFYRLPTEIKKAYTKLESEGLNAILPEGSQRVLLVVDQFEELFTVCPNEQERQEFIRLLAEGADHEGRLMIATTMRADFVEQALQYPALAKLIQRDRAFWLVPLEPSELREAIAEPTRMQGYELAEGLLEVICQDVEAEKNSLPLLEFALTELWEKRDRQNHRLTLTAYAEMGKLHGALDRHAKQLYEGLSSDLERDWTRRLFLQLVRTGQDVRDTRQRQAKHFLLGMARLEIDQEVITNLLEIFAGSDGRLLTMGDEHNAAFVDLAHEALMDGWQMFKEWRSQDRDLRRLCDRVNDAFQEFNNAKEEDKDKFLLSEGIIAQIEEKGTAINDYPLPEEFVQHGRYKYKPWLNPANLPEMVDIPSGTFWMGSPEGIGNDDEKPYHQVTVKAFQIGKYPVTQAQWRTVAMSPKVAIDLSLNPSYYSGENKPVEQVTWYEAHEFCARLSRLTGECYRLPTESEWEYACRAGTAEYAEYCFGDDPSQLDDYGWYGKNSGDLPIDAERIWEEVNQDFSRYLQCLRQNNNGTHPVGEKLPNTWGLYDMHGNVWEWCTNDWHDDYNKAPTESRIWTKDIKNHEDGATEKLLRGGSWDTNARNCRSAYRYKFFARIQFYISGFRVVCVA